MTMTTPIIIAMRPRVVGPPDASVAHSDDVFIDKDWTTNDGRDATRRFNRGFASHRGGNHDDGFDDDFDERERGP